MGEKYHSFAAAEIEENHSHLTLFAENRRTRVFEVIIGSAATPADSYAKWVIRRYTTGHGTETGGFTPVNLDPDGPAADADAGAGKFSAEPTYTAGSELFVVGLNQRATFRWVAAPGCELIGINAANNGLGLCPVTCGGTAIHTASMFHEE